MGELVNRARSWAPSSSRARRLEAQTGSSTPPSQHLLLGAQQRRPPGQVWGAEAKPQEDTAPRCRPPRVCGAAAVSPQLEGPPSRRGRKVRTERWPDISEVPGKLEKLSGPGALQPPCAVSVWETMRGSSLTVALGTGRETSRPMARQSLGPWTGGAVRPSERPLGWILPSSH